MTTRAEVRDRLATCDPDALRLVLHAAGAGASAPWGGAGGDTAPELAARIADAIWWSYATPLGYVADRASFEEIVRHLAKRLGLAHRVDPELPVYEQVRRLTEVLDGTLPDLNPRLGPSLGLGTGAAGSFGARWGTARVLAFLRTPIGRLLPLLPWVGPWVAAIRAGAGAVFAVSGPLGIALTVLSVNASLGTNYRKLVPLVLGVGALDPR